MAKPLTFLCVGSATQDVFLSQSPELDPVCEDPEDCFFNIPLGGKVNVNKIDFSIGGGATNAATTFARVGENAIFMGQIADDPAGAAVLDALDKENIDSSYASYSKRYHTGYSVLLLASTGERTILTYRGASTHYDPKNFKIDKIDASWIYLSSMAGNMDILENIFTSAKNKGICGDSCHYLTNGKSFCQIFNDKTVKNKDNNPQRCRMCLSIVRNK